MGYVFRKPGRKIWMMKYYRNGQPIYESTETDSERQARKICRERETDIARGLPVTADLGKVKFEDAAAAMQADYVTNNRRSGRALEYRIRLHLTPYFAGWKMADITPADVTRYVATRRARRCRQCAWRATDQRDADLETCPDCGARTRAGAKPGAVNRDLQALKRMFAIAVRDGTLLHQPHIAMLNEKGNVRKGFFEAAAFASVRAHLPPELASVATFAYVTGWRVDSEVLPLEWRHVDLAHNEVRLDPGVTKNDEPRVFPLTDELRALLLERQRVRDALGARGRLCPWVFFRLVAKGRGGLSPQHKAYGAIVATPQRITRFDKAWQSALAAAGQPGRLRHDFRRTAVRNMVRRGIPEAVAMKLAGFKTRSVFERYNIVSPGDLLDARAKLEGLGAADSRIEKETPTETPRARSAPSGRRVR